ncbi:MAG TPA: 16S rRNA (guanine(527)-N(7))-methyltransferase RsmG [Bryobacteraceae bacterium]|nr:16S rRNA (guanine(527)-N(7))-methyltransferase RsmG [Bryobacteraceae bacterium]
MFAELLRERLQGIIELSEEQIAQLQSHYTLLTAWNKRLNLTSIRNMEEAIERHYCESLFLSAHLPAEGTVADIGSGAGFPGIPLAIVKPKLQITLIESHKRKAVFLQEASRSLTEVTVVPERAEAVTDRYEWAVSRAVSYEDLASFLPNMSSRAALLTGNSEPPLALGFHWDASISLPWGRQRFLRIGTAL